jgi:hypothetical protein
LIPKANLEPQLNSMGTSKRHHHKFPKNSSSKMVSKLINAGFFYERDPKIGILEYFSKVCLGTVTGVLRLIAMVL